nr:hypothetical protein [Candidatus Sigynarchaeota archaeon]
QFFGEEIAKLLKEKRGGDFKVTVVLQYEEPPEFLLSFESLLLLDGDYSRSVLKMEEVQSKSNFTLYRAKTEAGYLFQEMPKIHDSISSNDSFLFDLGDDLIIWHGRDANPIERQHSEEIAGMFIKTRGTSARIRKIEEGNEPAYEQIPHDVWTIIVSEEKANLMKTAHEKTVLAIETRQRESERKIKQENELKRIEEEKRALDEIERVERQMLEKEIERKKDQLTPQQIEGLWLDFRRKMRVRRGLPEEEEKIKVDTSQQDQITVKQPALVQKTLEQLETERKEAREAKIKELEQLRRIELEMLEKKIARDKPEPDIERKWRADLEAKMQARWKELEE